MQFVISLAIAVVPVALLCVYVYQEDRYEKESIPFLLLLFATGAVCALASAVLKYAGLLLLDKLFSPYASFTSDGIAVLKGGARLLYHFLSAFVLYAGVDILLLCGSLFAVSFKNQNFNAVFDGVVYAEYVLLGFTLVELIFFGAGKGWDLVALKCLTTLPMRMFVGVLLGYNYSKIKLQVLLCAKEKAMQPGGQAPTCRCGSRLCFMVLFPYLLWGIFEFTALADGALWRWLYYIVLTAMCFVTVKKMDRASAEDALFDVLIEARLGANDTSGDDAK